MNRRTSSAWATSTRIRRSLPEPVSKYLSAVDGLEDVAKRFQQVIIECLPVLELIRRYDSPDTFFYCDPPYPANTRFRNAANVYAHEMDLEEHVKLLELLRECKAKVAISSYSSPLYDNTLREWNKIVHDAVSHVSNSGQGREEVLWVNFSTKADGSLF